MGKLVAVKSYQLSETPQFDEFLALLENIETISIEICALMLLSGSQWVTKLYEVICDHSGVHLI